MDISRLRTAQNRFCHLRSRACGGSKMAMAQSVSPAVVVALVGMMAMFTLQSYAFVLQPYSGTSLCRQERHWKMRGSTTMTAHRHHLEHGKPQGSNGGSTSSPIITPATKLDDDDGSGSGRDHSGGRKHRRRRRPMIGPAVWAAFKEEQKGVTRMLLGIPDEEKPLEEEGDGRVDETVEEELRRRQQQQENNNKKDVEPKQKRSIPRTTLGAFMAETRARSPDMDAMVPIMKSVGKTCVAVSRLVRRAQIEGMAGLHQSEEDTDETKSGITGLGSGSQSVNVQGEVQKELDVLSNSIFLTGFCQPADMSCVASEEEETPRMCSTVVGEDSHGGEYAAVFDPLDGSANIEAGLPCGTIFGILRVSGSAREGQKAGPSTIVLPGRRLVAAGYCLYGPSTKLVFTLGAGVFEFTLEGEGREGGRGRGGDDDEGLGGGGLEFVLTRSNMRIPRSGPIYSVNEANSVSWSEAIQDYFQDLKTGMAASSPPSPPYVGPDGRGEDSEEEAPQVEGQYAGALVADIHNILVHGGVFAYPADVRNPNGKLRLLYEGNPIAMIVEEAGGVATTGFEAIRDVRPQSVHHRIPAFFGSPDDLLPLLNPRYLHSKKRR